MEKLCAYVFVEAKIIAKTNFRNLLSAKRIDTGKFKFSGQEAPAVPQQRARSIPPSSSRKSRRCLFFQSTVCIFRHRPPLTPDDQATLQNRGCPMPKQAAKLPKPVDSKV